MTYRTDGRPVELSGDPDLVAAAQKAAAKKRIIIVGVIAAVLVGGGTTAAFVVNARTKAETQKALDKVATCLVGDASSAADKPGMRFRNSQLAVMSVPPEQRVQPGEEPWPARCVGPAHALSETLRAAGGTTPLADTAEKLAKAMGGDQGIVADVGPLVDKLFADASAEKLAAKRSAGMQDPPAGARPMTLQTLDAKARLFGVPLVLSSVYPSQIGDPIARFVADDKDFAGGPAVCALAPGAKTFACKKVPPPAAALSPALRLWGTTDTNAVPYVFAGEKGKSGMFRSDTGAAVPDKLEYGGAYGASSLDDGSFAFLKWQEKPDGTQLVRVTKGGTRETQLVVLRKESGNPYYSAGLFWNFVAYKGVTKNSDGIRLFVRTLEPAGELTPAVNVGRIDEAGLIDYETNEAHLNACRAEGTTIIRAKGRSSSYLFFLVAGRWSSAVESRGTAGQLWCRPGEAVISNAWGRRQGDRYVGTAVQSRCTVSGCEVKSEELEKALRESPEALPRDGSTPKVVDIDGKALVAWMSDKGGLRLRIAPMDQLALAKDVIVFDDHVRDGTVRVESTIVDFTILPTPGAAVLLLGTVEGVYAYRVDATGKLEPVATQL